MPEAPQTTLHSSVRDGITAADALRDCAALLAMTDPHAQDGSTAKEGAAPKSTDVMGLFYTPRRCWFARLAAEAPRDHLGQPVPLSSVFEMRVFGPAFELRWLHEESGRGRAVLLGESQPGPLAGWNESVPKTCLDTIDRQYLLWGTGNAARKGRGGGAWQPGWSLLFEGQIGELAVPLAGIDTNNQRAVLNAVEYLAEGDDDGNVVVVEERLTGLAPYRTDSTNNSDAASSAGEPL